MGELIKKLRKRAGYKQKDFAEACSISTSYLSQIENGSRQPQGNALEKIANKLEIPTQVLFILTLSPNDIPDRKKDAFNLIFPSFKAFLLELFPAVEGAFEYQKRGSKSRP